MRTAAPSVRAFAGNTFVLAGGSDDTLVVDSWEVSPRSSHREDGRSCPGRCTSLTRSKPVARALWAVHVPFVLRGTRNELTTAALRAAGCVRRLIAQQTGDAPGKDFTYQDGAINYTSITYLVTICGQVRESAGRSRLPAPAPRHAQHARHLPGFNPHPRLSSSSRPRWCGCCSGGPLLRPIATSTASALASHALPTSRRRGRRTTRRPSRADGSTPTTPRPAPSLARCKTTTRSARSAR